MAREPNETDNTIEPVTQNPSGDLVDRIITAGMRANGTSSVGEIKSRITKLTESNGATEQVKQKGLKIIKGLEETQSEAEFMPDHIELAQVYEGSISKKRLEIDEAIFNKALAINAIEDLNVSQLKEFRDEPPDFEADRTKVEPTIYIKPITQTPNSIIGKLKKEKELTDEVLVVINLNNGTDEYDTTVLTCVLKREGNKLLYGNKPPYPALFSIKSQKEFNNYYAQDDKGNFEDKSPEAKAARGESTMAKYLYDFKYRKLFGTESLEDYWKKHDAHLVKDPEKHWLAEKNIEKLMEDLSLEYTDLLQDIRQNEAKIISDFEKEVQEARELTERAIRDATSLVRTHSKLDPEVKRERIKVTLFASFGTRLSDAEINNIVERTIV